MRTQLISISALLFAVSLAAAQPKESKLPDGLRHVPLDAVGFVHIRAGDFLSVSDADNRRWCFGNSQQISIQLGIHFFERGCIGQIQTARSRSVMAMVGARNGTVMDAKRCSGPAPSISAAS